MFLVSQTTKAGMERSAMAEGKRWTPSLHCPLNNNIFRLLFQIPTKFLHTRHRLGGTPPDWRNGVFPVQYRGVGDVLSVF